MDEMINLTDQFLLNLKNRAEEIILANIDSEINYIFTNDEEYLNKRTKLIPRSEKEEQPKIKAGEPAPKQDPKIQQQNSNDLNKRQDTKE